MKIKKIIIVPLLLLIPVLVVGCNRAAKEVENTTPATIVTEPTELTDKQYSMVLMDVIGRNSDGFQQIAALSEKFGDADWEVKMNIELEKIRAASLEYLEIQNVPEKYSKVHEHTTEAMLYYILAVDSYPVKSADQSVESFAITTDYMTKGTASIKKATEELNNVK